MVIVYDLGWLDAAEEQLRTAIAQSYSAR